MFNLISHQREAQSTKYKKKIGRLCPQNTLDGALRVLSYALLKIVHPRFRKSGYGPSIGANSTYCKKTLIISIKMSTISEFFPMH